MTTYCPAPSTVIIQEFIELSNYWLKLSEKGERERKEEKEGEKRRKQGGGRGRGGGGKEEEGMERAGTNDDERSLC